MDLIEGKLIELVKEINITAKPQTKDFMGAGIKTGNRTNKMEESLDHLRIYIKYRLFDLEATRRENRNLRQLLNEDRK